MVLGEEAEQCDQVQEPQPLTAIVADDHEGARTRIREILEELGVQVVAEVAHGDLVLDKIQQVRPRLATLDIRMPGVNGLALAQAIKQHCPDTRVFIITNYPNEYYRHASEEVGADAFIPKAEAYLGLRQAVLKWFGPFPEDGRDLPDDPGAG